MRRYGLSSHAFILLMSLPANWNGEVLLKDFRSEEGIEAAPLAWADTMHLARAHNLSSYDAAYLELAIRLGLPLAAQDGKLKTAAEAVGVPLFEVI